MQNINSTHQQFNYNISRGSPMCGCLDIHSAIEIIGLKPFPSEELEAYRVTPKMNSFKYYQPDNIKPI